MLEHQTETRAPGVLRRLRPRTRLIAARNAWRDARTRAAFRRYARRGLALEGPRPGEIPVIICMWRRPERLAPILDMLEGQVGAGTLRLYIWNNDATRDAEYRAVLAGRSAAGALAGTVVHSSRRNIGGAARFLLARAVARAGYRGPMVLIDDDEQVQDDFVARLLAAWSPRTYAGVWAWRIHGDYWNRTRAAHGEQATYVGTGGAVVDSDVLGDDDLIRQLPLKRLFLEDIWLSAFAARNGCALRAVDAPFEFTDPEGDQWHALAARKSEFFDELGRPGLLPL